MVKFFKQPVKILLEFFEIVFICTAVFVVIYLFVGQLFEVTGDSMYPNFHDKEQIIAEKVSVNFKGIKRGEVIIFKHPTEPGRLLIKRVIGLPLENIKMSNGLVYINDTKLNEPYLSANTLTEGKRFLNYNVDYQIPENSYVVMGDNREKSTDSREWGFVPKNLIVGRGILVYYPLNRIRLITSALPR